MAGFGARLPLIRSDSDGFHELSKTFADMVKQNFKMIMLTSPGERMMNPSFGVGLRRYLFENRSAGLEEDLTLAIDAQVRQYLPMVEILSVNFNRPPNEGAAVQAPEDLMTLAMRIQYRITNINVFDSLTLQDLES